jgi:SAM-dependent methyltransferase
MAMRDYYLIRGKDAEADTVYTAVVRAINWMVGQIEGDGTILNQSREVFQFRPGEYAPEAVYLYALEPLLRACKSYRRDEEILARVKESIVRYTPRTVPETLDHYQYYIGEALFDLGIIPPLFNSPPPKYTTTPGKYQEFIIMKKRGFDIPGLVYTGLNGNHEDYFMNESIPWAAKFFLDALYWEMRISFHQDQEHPYCISNEDPRMEALRKNVVGYRVLDAGAGTGRYAYQLMQEHPCWKFQCCDIADDMVSFMRSRCIPADRASLMNLPYHPDQFDCAYCIEALEHAVNKPAAIAELCRVVRSNGRVIIIDKSEDTTVPMRLAPWEEWPRKYDVMRELGKYCVDCRYTDIDNIFTAWVGVVE